VDVADGPGSGEPTDRPGELVSRFAHRLQGEHADVDALLQAIAAAAVLTVPGAEAGSISYVDGRRRLQSRAATGDLPRDVDAVQDRLQEGPCLDAARGRPVVRVEDTHDERRWPRFAVEAAALGVRSSLSLRLEVEDDRLGALNLFARTPGAFTEESVDLGMAIAAHAATALTGARTEAHLRTAMASRDLIGQAKGILMERYKLTAAQAFTVLTRASQDANRKVVDIALELTDTGAMPVSAPSDGAAAPGTH
jgi:GAF domain-containing protein